MVERKLQRGFAEQYATAAFNRNGRERKARKVLAILEDSMGNLGNLKLLDIGCSTGYMSCQYAKTFQHVTATDIDIPAVLFAKSNNASTNLDYLVMDSQKLAYSDASFDAVTCTHIYEHVPSAPALMQEIYRVLKPGGVCFFSAGNRLSWMEPHYQLPLLSIIPKQLAHVYLKWLGRGNHYYETHLTYWGLRSLVRNFDAVDYTSEVVKWPEKYHAEDMITPGSLKQRLILVMLKLAYWVCPTYLWVLRKT